MNGGFTSGTRLLVLLKTSANHSLTWCNTPCVISSDALHPVLFNAKLSSHMTDTTGYWVISKLTHHHRLITLWTLHPLHTHTLTGQFVCFGGCFSTNAAAATVQAFSTPHKGPALSWTVTRQHYLAALGTAGNHFQHTHTAQQCDLKSACRKTIRS